MPLAHRLNPPATGLLARLRLSGLSGLLGLLGQTCAVLLIGGCVAPAAPPLPMPPVGHDLLLLGEVHDNAAGQAQRLALLQRLIAQGARPALLMEQFDRQHQPAIDHLLAAPAGSRDAPDTPARQEAQVDALVALAAPPGAAASGWDWRLYRPLLRLALQYRLPLVAANVSRDEVRAVMQQGLAAQGFDATVPIDIELTQAGEIERSHCGAVDAALARRMASAQVARDQFMARQVQAHAGGGDDARAAPSVVLLAGNGHLRRDVGVPRWLPPAWRERTWVIAFVESDGAAAGAFDQAVTVAAAPRGDPCAALRQR